MHIPQPLAATALTWSRGQWKLMTFLLPILSQTAVGIETSLSQNCLFQATDSTH